MIFVDVLFVVNGGIIIGVVVVDLEDIEVDDYGIGFVKLLVDCINLLCEDGVEGLEGVYVSVKIIFEIIDVVSIVVGDVYVGSGSLVNVDFSINGVNIGFVEV